MVFVVTDVSYYFALLVFFMIGLECDKRSMRIELSSHMKNMVIWLYALTETRPYTPFSTLTWSSSVRVKMDLFGANWPPKLVCEQKNFFI